MGLMRCYWVEEPGVGRVLVPGCWNRAIYGDNALCQCPKGSKSPVEALAERVKKLEAEVIRLSPKGHAP